MKNILLVFIVLFAVTARADPAFIMMGSSEYKFRASFGTAWYHDHRGYQYDLQYQPQAVDALALYVQTPIVSIYQVDICFGGVVPLQYVERTRPEFSLSTLIGEHVEVGAYCAVSPYRAYGVMLGWRF